FHSCGTVPPHGVDELVHPEPGLTIVGSKSYGRAPTFLMVTGYEQVRSVVADIAGDREAAHEVRLVLPETGVCSGAPVTDPEAVACCGGPAPNEVDACCVKDAEAKMEGGSGCGCASSKGIEVAPTADAKCCQSAA
ncbi:MAG: flavoprotein, partial [Mesorhizobium sp.]|nr:flavoprotein [Mesorhizobium sp.]